MKHILLIEDNHNLREEISNVLELEGFDVRTAENGRVGLARIQEEVPDLVLCDLMMPDMDGYETLKAIRGNPATHTLPVDDSAPILQNLTNAATPMLRSRPPVRTVSKSCAWCAAT